MEKLQKHQRAKDAMLFYFIFDSLLENQQENFDVQKVDLDCLEEEELFTMSFNNKNLSKKIEIKGILLEQQNSFSFNCLKGFESQEIFSIDLPLYKTEDDFDIYLKQSVENIKSKIIDLIFGKNREKLQPRNINEFNFIDSYMHIPQRPMPTYIPNIRIDQEFPPNVIGGRNDLFPPELDPNNFRRPQGHPDMFGQNLFGQFQNSRNNRNFPSGQLQLNYQ